MATDGPAENLRQDEDDAGPGQQDVFHDGPPRHFTPRSPLSSSHPSRSNTVDRFVIVGPPVTDPHWQRNAKFCATVVSSPVPVARLCPPNGIVLFAAVPGMMLLAELVTQPRMRVL